MILTRLAWGSLGLFAGWSCLEDVRGVNLGVCEVLFLAVNFRLRLGLEGEIRGGSLFGRGCLRSSSWGTLC